MNNDFQVKLLKVFLQSLLFINLITKISPKGMCGNIVDPKNSTQCLPFSTSDYFCCLLKIEDSPSNFNACYIVEKNTASSTVIQIGKMTYKIDCSGITDFYKYFPFEEKFKPCSTSNPKSISTCTDFIMENNAKCCLGIIKNYPDIRKCYSTVGLAAKTINYTTTYGDQITLLCDGQYINLRQLKFFFNKKIFSFIFSKYLYLIFIIFVFLIEILF